MPDLHMKLPGTFRRVTDRRATVAGATTVPSSASRRRSTLKPLSCCMHVQPVAPAVEIRGWCSNRVRLVLGQVKVDNKSDEFAAMPKLLEMPALKGRIVTADAHPGGDGQGRHRQGRELCAGAQGRSGQPAWGCAPVSGRSRPEAGNLPSCRHVDGDRGRIKTRRATVCHEIAWLRGRHDRPGLATFGKIASRRETAKSTKTETRHYIMSTPLSPERFRHAARAHWAIENCPHRVLDATMNEDRQRNRKQHGPETLALLRRLALNIARRKPSKDALRGKLKRAAWNHDFLLNLIRAAA